ncbi:hypothetical protein JTE90_023973 [Oedothorax gibbosus]|uniref:CCHC-type domain-containing protein n=1 Tax=Oedothorax gibbosus TaxID=931172 RepID=A0AAV6UHU5_9ARAC|nr:hypothetical protein JTE90_023973 [Oedothorax gibbosus]
MDFFRPPPALDFTETNLAESWKRWRQCFENFMLAAEKTTKPEKTKIAIILSCIGQEGVEVYNSFVFEAGKETLQEVLSKFGDYCAPMKNVVFERFNFFRCFQKGQNIESFVTELKNLAGTCEFKEDRDDLIRDRVVIGIRDVGMQERLLREPDLSLDRAVEFVRTSEISKRQIASMNAGPSECCCTGSTPRTRAGGSRSMNTGPFVNTVAPDLHRGRGSGGSRLFRCQACGRIHQQRGCPAQGKPCFRCGDMGHFRNMCRGKQRPIARSLEVQEIAATHRRITSDESDSSEVPLFIDSLDSMVSERSNEWTKVITVHLNQCLFTVTFKLDIGAEANILPLNAICGLESKIQLEKTNTVLVSYGNFKIKPLGVVMLECSYDNFSPVGIKFFIVDTNSKPLLGLNACQKLNLIQRICEVKGDQKSEILEIYQDVFKGLGTFPDDPYHVELKPDSVGVVHPPRRVPQVIRGKLKDTLDDLENRGIMKRLTILLTGFKVW